MTEEGQCWGSVFFHDWEVGKVHATSACVAKQTKAPNRATCYA